VPPPTTIKSYSFSRLELASTGYWPGFPSSLSDKRSVVMRLVKKVAPALDIQELGEETEDVQWL
jgi:hypothetical protein